MRQPAAHRRFRNVRQRLASAVLGTMGWAVVAVTAKPAAAADQLVAFDETYVQELNGNVRGETFHHGIKPAATEPASWLAPVNYAKGTAYLYMEVLSKPSKRSTLLTMCFDGPKAGYGCFNSKSYTDVGAFETKVIMGGAGWGFGYAAIAWGQRRDDYHLVIKDAAGGGGQGGTPTADFVPTQLRVVLTIVPPDGTYVPPAPGPGFSRDGGAAADASPSDAAVADAAAERPNTGGTGGGSGGTSGGAGGGGGGATSGGSGGGNTGGTSGNGGAGQNAGGSSGAAAGGMSTSGGSGGSRSTASGGSSGTTDTRAPSSSGCSVARSHGNAGIGMLAWLGLALGGGIARRRRSAR